MEYAKREVANRRLRVGEKENKEQNRAEAVHRQRIRGPVQEHRLKLT